jgi:rifampin ADP-ribosylating transferase
VKLATGISLAFTSHGTPSGDPVLLLHAWGESRRCFDLLLPALPADLHVLAVDQRGHGDSDTPPDGYSLPEAAADVEAFLDAVDIPQAVLVGSSSGGYVAQQVAVTSPDRVSGLVLVGSPRSLLGRPAFADEVESLSDPVSPDWVRQSLTWFPAYHDIPAWYLDDRVSDGARIPAHVWRDAFQGLITARPPTESGTITAPTLVIWGQRDDLLPRDHAERLAAVIPCSQLTVYPDTGHLVLWEQPEQVAADVAAFVAGLDFRR